jgi:diguanylate cyclase (GGDEF)-like protein
MESRGGPRPVRHAPTLLVPCVVAAVYLAAFGTWQLFGRGDADAARWVSDLAPLPAGAAAVATALWAARRAPTPRLRLAWRLLASAFGLFALGDAVWFVYEVGLGESPYPSAADAAYLAMYPVLVAALLAFPVARRSRRQRATLMFDYAVVFLAAALGVWYLVIGPTATGSDASRLEIALSVTYPVADLVVLFGLLTVLARGVGDTPRRAVIGLFAGVACFLASDLVFGYLSIHDRYRAGDFPDTLWIAASLLVVIAAWPAAPRLARATPATVDEPGLFSRMSAVPFLMILFVWSIVIVETHDDASSTLIVLLGGGIALTTVVFVRQLTAQREARTVMERYHALANADGLTGLASRRRFFEYGARAATLAERRGDPVSVVMIDVDGFKAINDGWGHSVGDAALGAIADTLRNQLESPTVIGRFGGDEFVALLIGVPERQVQRLTESISTFAIPVPGTDGALVVRVTAGSATARHADLDRLLRAADRALYERRAAVRSGASRSRPVVVDPEQLDHVADIRVTRDASGRRPLRSVREHRVGFDPPVGAQLGPDPARKAEVRRVVPVDVADLAAPDEERDLTQLADVDLDAGPGADLGNDPVARRRFHRS